MTRCLKTTGNGYFEECVYELPELCNTDIRVEAIMTGVCRSDIEMMKGEFGPLPLHMQGHEGLGRVVEIGSNVIDIKVGDYVATRGEPAYADYYNVRKKEYVYVPEAHPRYILEPVACGINVVKQAHAELIDRTGKVAILGSGFLAWVAYNTLKTGLYYDFSIDVFGNSNRQLWYNERLTDTYKIYDVVIDLSGKYDIGPSPGIQINNNALIIDAVGKAVSKSEAQAQLWKAVTTIKPSPRSDGFFNCMIHAREAIEDGTMDVDCFWTRAYNRNTEWQQAFADGANRPNGYSRGYIKWA